MSRNWENKQKLVKKPKHGFKLFVVRCTKCGIKSLVELRKQQKSIKETCNRCETTNRHKIVGKIKKQYVKWNSMRIKWF